MPLENSAFHDELLYFLREDLEKKKKEDGWDDRNDEMMRSYSDAISQAIRSSGLIPLDEIIEKHRYLFEERGPMHLEQKLLNSFPDHELTALHFKPVRMIRGLPRLYRKNHPQISKLKPQFSHLPSLKRTAALKMLCSLYGKTSIPAFSKMAILSWVIPDGLGDFYASSEAVRLIKSAFPSLEVHFIVISEKELPLSPDCPAIRWDGSDSQIELLGSCDLILQMPTYYPKTNEIKARIETFRNGSGFPKWEMVGEYGFLESDWFHPRTKAHSMGLHFLERGILTRTVDPHRTGFDLSNEQLSCWLFDRCIPGSEEISQYRQKRRFFLAYLYSHSGIFVYLHAILKSLENDSKDIDLCVPDSARILAYFEQRLQSKLDPIEKGYQIGKIVFHIGSQVAVWNGDTQGKTLRILFPDSLTSSDFQQLIGLSEEFVACRGDQSLSEVVSNNKCFFYDPRDHSRYFLKDLIALAQNRIAEYASSVDVLRLFAKVLEHNLPEETGDWVDEISIQQQKMNLLEIAETMGRHLQDPKTFAGFKKLNRILIEEYSCNEFILHLVQRAICHRRYPEIESLEEEELSRFAYGQQSFSLAANRLIDRLHWES
jgi:hypothetical protein